MTWDPDFEEFAAQQAAALLRTAAFLTGDRHGAQDLLQTALVRTALHWRTARLSPTAYTRRVLINLVRDNWRTSLRRVREVPLHAGWADTVDYRLLTGAEGGYDSPESLIVDRDQLLSALRQLPARQRTAVVLRYWEELSVTETAGLMGCTEGTVKSTCSKGLEQLRHLLATTDVEGTPAPGPPQLDPARRRT